METECEDARNYQGALVRGMWYRACDTEQILLSEGQEEQLSRSRKTLLTLATALEDYLCPLCTET